MYFPDFSKGVCTYSILLLEVDTNWFGRGEAYDITDQFYSMKRPKDATFAGAYRFIHYNHANCDQLEMLIRYEKDGRKVTGESGLRIIIDGNSVKELGVDERLVFEV